MASAMRAACSDASSGAWWNRRVCSASSRATGVSNRILSNAPAESMARYRSRVATPLDRPPKRLLVDRLLLYTCRLPEGWQTEVLEPTTDDGAARRPYSVLFVQQWQLAEQDRRLHLRHAAVGPHHRSTVHDLHGVESGILDVVPPAGRRAPWTPYRWLSERDIYRKAQLEGPHPVRRASDRRLVVPLAGPAPGAGGHGRARTGTSAQGWPSAKPASKGNRRQRPRHQDPAAKQNRER